MTAPYIWIGRKLRHAHSPVGTRLEVNPDDSSVKWLLTHPGIRDHNSCNCGYAVCSQTGPCAPPPPPPKDELPEGWRREPDGIDGEEYAHVSGARVEQRLHWQQWAWWPTGEGSSPSDTWKPTRNEAMAAALASMQPAKPDPVCFGCGAPKSLHPENGRMKQWPHCQKFIATRPSYYPEPSAETLAAYRELVPAEPELRPGWEARTGGTWWHVASGAPVYRREDGRYRVSGDNDSSAPESHATLHAAMLRAEELAAQRGSR